MMFTPSISPDQPVSFTESEITSTGGNEENEGTFRDQILRHYPEATPKGISRRGVHLRQRFG